MDISKLREKDIGEFERRWPDAAAFLRHRELVNERWLLRREAAQGIPLGSSRAAWVTSRLKELEFLGDAT
jgi:hypothetical protein